MSLTLGIVDQSEESFSRILSPDVKVLANIIEMHHNSLMGNRIEIVGELAEIHNPIIHNRFVAYVLQKELGIVKQNIDIVKIRSHLLSCVPLNN